MIEGIVIGLAFLMIASYCAVKVARHRRSKAMKEVTDKMKIHNKNEKDSQEKPFEEKELLDNKKDKSAENVRIVPEMIEAEYEADNKTIKTDINGNPIIKKKKTEEKEEQEMEFKK